VPLDNIVDSLSNITTEHLYFIVITLALGIFTFFFVKLVRGILQTLDRVNNTADSVNNILINQVQPTLEGFKRLEDTLEETIMETRGHVENLQADTAKLMDVLTTTLSSYGELEKTLQDRLEKEVPPILDETRGLVTGARQITDDIQEKIKATDNLFQAVSEAGQTVKLATGIVRGGLTGLAIQLGSMAVGARTSLEYLSENITKKDTLVKGGDSNE